MKLRLFGPSAQEAPPGSCRGGCIRQVGPVRPVAVGGSLSGPVNCTAWESTVSTLNTCCCTAPQLEPSGADWLATRPVHLPVGLGPSRDRASSHIYSVIHCTHTHARWFPLTSLCSSTLFCSTLPWSTRSEDKKTTTTLASSLFFRLSLFAALAFRLTSFSTLASSASHSFLPPKFAPRRPTFSQSPRPLPPSPRPFEPP